MNFDVEKAKNSSQVSKDPSFKIRSTATDPIVNCFQKPKRNFCHATTRDSPISESPANLADLTKEFNDLTRKMALLQETLNNSYTGCGKRTGTPALVNSASQALQASNLDDISGVRRLVRDCIVELTFVDHFLRGDEKSIAVYREKLQKAISQDGGAGKDIVVRKNLLSNICKVNSPDKDLGTEVAVGTFEDSSKRGEKLAEVQTDLAKAGMNETSRKKNMKNEPRAANGFSKDFPNNK